MSQLQHFQPSLSYTFETELYVKKKIIYIYIKKYTVYIYIFDI